jgi:hypothetical protein
MIDVAGGKNLPLYNTLIYDGQRNPDQLWFNIESLTPGNEYGISVIAFNFNGQGEASDTAYYKSCTAPSGQGVPTVLSTTSTQIYFQWTAP